MKRLTKDNWGIYALLEWAHTVGRRTALYYFYCYCAYLKSHICLKFHPVDDSCPSVYS
jgi:hypothetical protein